MSRNMKIYVRYNELDDKTEHFVKWFVGLLHMRGVVVKCVEFECNEPVEIGLVKMEVESGMDMLNLALMLGIDFVRLMRSCPMEVRVAVCENGECIDMNVEDWEKWYEELVWNDAGTLI